MKKTIALLLALVMMFALCACGQSAAPAATEAPTAEPAADAEPARPHFDKLTLEFVPSKDADVIITGTKDLPELVKAEMANLGYDIDEPSRILRWSTGTGSLTRVWWTMGT